MDEPDPAPKIDRSMGELMVAAFGAMPSSSDGPYTHTFTPSWPEDDLSTAEGIVRALAEGMWVSEDDEPNSWCDLCDSTVEEQQHPGWTAVQLIHEESCLWQKAIAWTEAHPRPIPPSYTVTKGSGDV